MSDKQGVRLIRAWNRLPRHVRSAMANLAENVARDSDGGRA
jgi:hypothetical protein